MLGQQVAAGHAFLYQQPQDLSSRLRGLKVVLLAAAALSLAACGGGDDGTQDSGTNSPAPVPTLQALSGDWVQRGCVRTGAQSFKRVVRATLVQPRDVDYAEGVLSFNNSECSGTGQLVGPSLLGRLTFYRSEANAALTAHWAEFRTVTGQRSGAIWTLQANGSLCLLGDNLPSIQPTLVQVASSVATIPTGNCFQRATP